MQAGWVLGGSCSAWRVDVVVVFADVPVMEVKERDEKVKEFESRFAHIRAGKLHRV